MKSDYSKEEIMKKVYEYLKPLGLLGHLNKLNNINWAEVDSTGKKKTVEIKSSK